MENSSNSIAPRLQWGVMPVAFKAEQPKESNAHSVQYFPVTPRCLERNDGEKSATSKFVIPADNCRVIPPQLEICEDVATISDGGCDIIHYGQIACELNGRPAWPADPFHRGSDPKSFFFKKAGLTITVSNKHNNQIVRIVKHQLFFAGNRFVIKSNRLYLGLWENRPAEFLHHSTAIACAYSRLECGRCKKDGHIAHFLPQHFYEAYPDLVIKGHIPIDKY